MPLHFSKLVLFPLPFDCPAALFPLAFLSRPFPFVPSGRSHVHEFAPFLGHPRVFPTPLARFCVRTVPGPFSFSPVAPVRSRAASRVPQRPCLFPCYLARSQWPRLSLEFFPPPLARWLIHPFTCLGFLPSGLPFGSEREASSP